jgi:hypothetical protein
MPNTRINSEMRPIRACEGNSRCMSRLRNTEIPLQGTIGFTAITNPSCLSPNVLRLFSSMHKQANMIIQKTTHPMQKSTNHHLMYDLDHLLHPSTNLQAASTYLPHLSRSRPRKSGAQTLATRPGHSPSTAAVIDSNTSTSPIPPFHAAPQLQWAL